MIVKKKENCREGGQRGFFIMTADFSSLQARLCSIDTFINDCPKAKFNEEAAQKALPDPVLLSVYRDGSDTSDLHSMTGFGTFVKSINMPAIHIHDDVDNKDYVFTEVSNVRVRKADGTEKKIQAKYLEVTDHILEHCKK